MDSDEFHGLYPGITDKIALILANTFAWKMHRRRVVNINARMRYHAFWRASTMLPLAGKGEASRNPRRVSIVKVRSIHGSREPRHAAHLVGSSLAFRACRIRLRE